MTVYRHIAALKPQTSETANRIIIEWLDPFNAWQSYAVNQRTLSRYTTAEELKAALDSWTFKTWGYTINDVWFHINRDGTWAMATGPTPPAVWPEDEPVIP